MKKLIFVFFITSIFFTTVFTHAATPAPVMPDTDQDGLIDAWETILGTDLNNPDSDGDGYKDGEEVAQGYSPLDAAPVKKEKLIKDLEDKKVGRQGPKIDELREVLDEVMKEKNVNNKKGTLKPGDKIKFE